MFNHPLDGTKWKFRNGRSHLVASILIIFDLIKERTLQILEAS